MKTQLHPLRDVRPLQELNRLAHEMWTTQHAEQTVALDVYRSGDHYTLWFDLPGVDVDSLELTMENGAVVVHAERGDEPDMEESTDPDAPSGFLLRERPRGRLSRHVVLGEGLDYNRVQADYRDGVLKVIVPLSEHSTPRRITVRHGDTATSTDQETGYAGVS